MAYANTETIQKSPIDFCYIFVTQDYLTKIAQVFSQKHAVNIKSKYTNAARYISGWGKNNGKTYDEAKQYVRNLIKEQYGYSPEQILIKWANGEMVAGKDYKNGVYGVGATPQLTFNQDASAKVDPTSGAISFGDNSPEALWRTIDTEGKTIEMNYTLGGKTYTSRYNPSTGQFMANTYGDASGMQFANGSEYTASKASSTWENLNTALPMVKDFMSWLASLIKEFVPITAANTVPTQSDYYVEDKSTSIAGFGIIGALLLGGVLLGTKRQNKKG